MAHKDSHRAYALFDIGEAYANLEEPDSACVYYLRSLDITKSICDTAMIQTTLGGLALNYLEFKKPDKAIAALSDNRHSLRWKFNTFEYGILATAHLMMNRLDSARYYLKQAESCALPNSSSQAHLQSVAAPIHFKTKEFDKAAEEYRYYAHVQDSLVRIALHQSYANVHRDYLDGQQQMANKRLHILRQRFWLSVALAVVFILFVAYIAYVNYRKRQISKAKYISAIDEIRNADRLMLLRLESLHQQKSQELQHVIKDRFAVIDELASTYYERKGTDEQRAIYNKVKSLLNSYASDEKGKQEIEEVVNLCYDDVMQKVRAELPWLKESELDLLRYIYAGFSLRVISVFMGDSINYVAVKKSRLKTKIAESSAPSKELFVELM